MKNSVFTRCDGGAVFFCCYIQDDFSHPTCFTCLSSGIDTHSLFINSIAGSTLGWEDEWGEKKNMHPCV